MTLQEQLCEKMRVEQSAYCLWLTAQPPEEILHHAYEYSVREDIILATEEMNLTLAQVRALLKSPAPLADVYKDFSKLETDYQQTRRRLTLDLKPGSGSSNLQTSAKIQRIKICTRPLRRFRPRR